MTALQHEGKAMSRPLMKRGVQPAAVYDRMTADLPINAVVAEAVVDDPYGYNGEKIRVTRSIRDDVLAAMKARNEIDDAQLAAGRLYERYAEQAEIGDIRAIDPAKESVDGGRSPETTLTDSQIAATRHMSEAARVLGRRGEWVMRAILIHRVRFKAIARSEREGDVAHVRRTFMDGLEDLAYLWGMSSKRR